MFCNWFGAVWNLKVSTKYGHSIFTSNRSGFNPFKSSVTFLYPRKTSENQRFFRGYRNVTLDWNELIQHIHRSAYVSGHILVRANLPNKYDELPWNWISSISSDRILCTWLSPSNTTLPENLAKIAFKK